MKKIYFVIALLAILFPNGFYSQCSLYPVALSAKVNNSSLIIEGKVISQKSFWNASRNYIYTSNLIAVNQVLKGSVISPNIELITEGGQIGLTKQLVDPSLQLDPNDEGVFMLNVDNTPSQFGTPVFKTYADQQGFIKFNWSENTAVVPFKNYNNIAAVHADLELALGSSFPNFVDASAVSRFVSSANSIAAISSISPSTITAGTGSILTINGTGFGATQGTSFVEFLNADDGGATYIKPHSSQYVSWSATQIQVMVPTKTGTNVGTAGTGPVRVTVGTATVSTQTLTINYGELNVLYPTNQLIYNTRHVGLNGMNGITWQMYTSFNANAAAKTAFLSAFQTWRCNTQINWLLGPSVTTNTIALDTVNVIRFDINGELPVGVLGRCTSYFNGCSLGPTINWFVSELDICFDDPATSAITWNFGPAAPTSGQYDFESVTVHELGHGHQLSHVINSTEVMHYSIANGQSKRTLVAADIAGGLDVMSRDVAAPICGKGNIVAITASLCAVGSPTAAFNLTSPVCVGQSVALTSTSGGGPTNFTWTATGGSAYTASVNTTATSYTAAGIYTVTLNTLNGIGTSSTTKTISVVAIPTIAVTSANICSGTSATLTASGGSSYTWTPGPLTGATQVLTPATTQVYTVLGSNGTCTNTSSGIVNVTTTPTVSVANATVCVGNSIVVNAGGATSYTWTPGNLNGASQSLSPAASTNYTVKGANGSCTDTKNFFLTVNPNPTVSMVASSTLICTGQTTTLNASGATSYTFNPGAIVGTPASVSPTSNTTFTVNGQTNGCQGTALLTVSVSLCTGINKISGVSDITLYPNPTQGLFTLNYGEDFTGQINVFNTLGQLLISQKINSEDKTELNLASYSKGIYLIKLTSINGKGTVVRVVKD